MQRPASREGPGAHYQEGLATALFVARHQHSPDGCPAADPQMGSTLLTRLSPDNAAVQGVTTDAEAVVNDARTLYLIVEADPGWHRRRYCQPRRVRRWSDAVAQPRRHRHSLGSHCGQCQVRPLHSASSLPQSAETRPVMSAGFMSLLAAGASGSNFLQQQAARTAGPGAVSRPKLAHLCAAYA